jgi:hypothetical protein
MTDDAITIGSIPKGARILRRSTPDDRREGPTRLIFYATEDGSQHWLHIDGHIETVLKVVQS